MLYYITAEFVSVDLSDKKVIEQVECAQEEENEHHRNAEPADYAAPA